MMITIVDCKDDDDEKFVIINNINDNLPDGGVTAQPTGGTSGQRWKWSWSLFFKYILIEIRMKYLDLDLRLKIYFNRMLPISWDVYYYYNDWRCWRELWLFRREIWLLRGEIWFPGSWLFFWAQSPISKNCLLTSVKLFHQHHHHHSYRWYRGEKTVNIC